MAHTTAPIECGDAATGARFALLREGGEKEQMCNSLGSQPAFGTLRSKPTNTSNSPGRVPSGTLNVTCRTTEK